MKNLSSTVIDGEQRKQPGSFRRFVAGSLCGLALLSSPMLESRAFAQEHPPVAQQSPARTRQAQYSVQGNQFGLRNGSAGISAYQVYDQQHIAPVISVEGPAVVTMRFYPLVNPADADQQTHRVNYTLRYTVDGGAPVEQAGLATEISQIASADTARLDLTGFAVGTPHELRIPLEAGSHRVSVTYPNGFLEIVSAVAPAPEPAVVVPQQPQPRPDQPPQQASPEPEHPATSPIASIRSTGALNYERLWLSDLGSTRNSGSIDELDVLYRHRFGDNFGLFVGPHLNLYTTGTSDPAARTDILMGNAALMAGVAFYAGEHTFYLAGFGGLQAVSTDLTLADGRNRSGVDYMGGFGGRLGYDWNNIIGASAELSNNPFNPGTFRLRVAIPYSWVRDARPTLDVSLRWLHLLRPNPTDAEGSGILDENNLLLRANALVPIWRLGPVVPSALVGFQYDTSLGVADTAGRADLLLGGAVSLDIADRFRVEAGAGSSLRGEPFILLNANLR
jgi:hypothetical protein